MNLSYEQRLELHLGRIICDFIHLGAKIEYERAYISGKITAINIIPQDKFIIDNWQLVIDISKK